jgi:hypothetical protein
MNAHEQLTDTELEAMLARLVARGRADGLEAAIMATVDTTPQQRGLWFRWPDWRLTPASELRLLWYVALVGLLLALTAGTLIVGSRLLEIAPTTPVRLPALVEGMVTEEVEPGVFRVVNDGVRNLSYLEGGYPGSMVDLTPDGSVWLSGVEDRYGLFQLGEEPVFRDVTPWPPDLEVAPDGSLWAIGDPWDFDNRIFSFDGEGWTERATKTDDSLSFGALAIGPDGTVWVAASDRDKYCSDTDSDECVGTVLMRLEDDGSLTAIEDWADVYDGYVSVGELAVSPAGDVWLEGMVGGRWSTGVEALLRFDGQVWELVAGPEGLVNPWVGQSLAIAPDGTLWVDANSPDAGGLARLDDSGWTVFTEADGVEPWGGQGFLSVDLLTVAPDGSLWMNGRPTSDGFGGVAHWDGTTWTSYLVEAFIDDLAVAPDGSVWLQASVEGSSSVHGTVYTYVIPPRL